MIRSLPPLSTIVIFCLASIACGERAEPHSAEPPQPTGAAGLSQASAQSAAGQPCAVREETQEAINRCLMAELRADPLLRFQPLYDPQYASAQEATHIADDDRVFGVYANGIAKAYPTWYIAWHHIIQDDFGATPVLASWCALCATGAAYLNDINGQPGTFRITGSVGSNVQLGDEKTGNAIQQATGEFVEGPLKGQKMERVTTVHATWAEWRAEHPDTLLMLPEPERGESYAHYKPMLGTAGERFRGAVLEDDRRPRHDLVVGLDTGGAYKAYPLKELAKQTLVNDQVGSAPVLVTYSPETDTARAFSRVVNGRTLTFKAGKGGLVQDTETASTWDITGLATAGPLQGTQLKVLPPLPSFWFSWVQFYPETEVFTAQN